MDSALSRAQEEIVKGEFGVVSSKPTSSNTAGFTPIIFSVTELK